MFFGDAADQTRLAAQVMPPHRCQYLIGVLFGDERDQLAFVGDQQRIESEYLARSADRVSDRNRGLVDIDPEMLARRNFNQRRREAAASWISHRMNIGTDSKHLARQFVQRGRVTFERALELESFARRQDRDSVISNRAGQKNCIAGGGRCATID